MLNDFGMKAQGVSSGEEAVEQVVLRHENKQDFFACIIDWKMPGMDGIATTRAIRAMNRSYCKQEPIIAMTANAFAEDIQAAQTVGMNEHIAKPLDFKHLSKTLNKWLKK